MHAATAHPTGPSSPRRGRGRRVAATTLALALVAACGSIDPEAPTGEAASAERVTLNPTSVTLGSPQAEQQIHVYQDLNCPHCHQLHDIMADDVDRWVQGDEVAVEVTVVDYLGPRTSHRFSTRGAQLLALVADVDPGAWQATQDALLAMQPSTTTEEISDEALFAAADIAELGDAGPEDLADYADQVSAATAEAADAGVDYIPQVFVDGELIAGESHEETAELVRDALGE